MTREILTTAVCLLASISLTNAADATVSAMPTTALENEINVLADIDEVAPILEKFSASVSADYESEFIFRGKQLAYGVVSPEVDLSYDIGAGFGTYVGWWGCYSTDDKSDYNENDLYVGLTYDIANFTFDFGYTIYTYPGEGTINENELKFVVSYDTSEYLGDYAVSPYLAGYYNITYSGTTLEGGLSYSAPVTKWLINQNWGSIDLAAYLGWADYSEGMSDHGGYVYVGVSADVTVAINEYCSISAGVRYAHNNDNDGGYVAIGGKEDNIWFGTSVSIGF